MEKQNADEVAKEMEQKLQINEKENPEKAVEEEIKEGEKKDEKDDGKKPRQPRIDENAGGQLIKGMRELEFKNIVDNLQAKKGSWDALKVPEELSAELEDLRMAKPSKIQFASIPLIMGSNENFLFQAKNGSGKTLSFGIPSMMKIDQSNPACQVLIIANTRELIRQVQQVINRVSKRTKITTLIGDTDTPVEGGQIIVTTPNWVKNRISKRKPLNLSSLKMIVYDEADEIFLQATNQECIASIMVHLKSKDVIPQHILFSATFPPDVMESINKFLPEYTPYTVPIEALKLKGVKMFRLHLNAEDKIQFISDIYAEFGQTQTMIFVNRKADGESMTTRLESEGTPAKLLIGKLEAAVRDKMIDQFRKLIIRSLICTNVLARGIDVPEVDLVINFDVPVIPRFGFKHADFASYMHRVGRTGRFGTDGIAVTLTSDETESDLLDQIAEHYQIDIMKLKDTEELKSIYKSMRSPGEEDQV